MAFNSYFLIGPRPVVRFKNFKSRFYEVTDAGGKSVESERRSTKAYGKRTSERMERLLAREGKVCSTPSILLSHDSCFEVSVLGIFRQIPVKFVVSSYNYLLYPENRKTTSLLTVLSYKPTIKHNKTLKFKLCVLCCRRLAVCDTLYIIILL